MRHHPPPRRSRSTRLRPGELSLFGCFWTDPTYLSPPSAAPLSHRASIERSMAGTAHPSPFPLSGSVSSIQIAFALAQAFLAPFVPTVSTCRLILFAGPHSAAASSSPPAFS